MSIDATDGNPPGLDGDALGSVEFLLFDSLVHHLIEKGLFTKNDALSVIQTAAEVVRGRLQGNNSAQDVALSTLERAYLSYEALPDRNGRAGFDSHNVHPLRNPLHGDRPRFPSDED